MAETVSQVRPVPPLRRIIVTTKEQLLEMDCSCRALGEYVFDTETTGLDITTMQLVGMSFFGNGGAYYIPLAHDDDSMPQLSIEEVLEVVKPLLEDEELLKTAHNLKFDYKVMRLYGVDIKGPCYDTMIATFLCDESWPKGLKVLEEMFLKSPGRDKLPPEVLSKILPYADAIEGKSLDELVGKVGKKGAVEIWKVPIAKAAVYAQDDVIGPYLLKEVLTPIMKEEKVWDAFERVEVPFARILGKMEFKGVAIDLEHLKEVGVRVRAILVDLHGRIIEEVGHEFSPDSPKQLAKVLFEEMHLPIVKTTGKGAPSTDAEVLETLAAKGSEFCQLLVEYRELKKIEGTYIEGLKHHTKKDGKIHANFNQVVAVTGRLSSSDPNLQNLPSGDKKTKIRNCIVAPPGYTFIVADYSQIELRVMGHFSGDNIMAETYAQSQDIHARTASEIFAVPYEDIIAAIAINDAYKLDQHSPKPTGRQHDLLQFRQLSKAINFGLIYGMGPKGLVGTNGGITLAQAKSYVQKYFARYAGVKEYIDFTHEFCAKYGFVRTLTGRKRRLPGIWSTEWAIKGSAQRMSVNTRIQGSAADLIKIAMLKLDPVLDEAMPDEPDCGILVQVHDELLVMVPTARVQELLPVVKDVMINAVQLKVPVEVGVAVCTKWGDAK